MAYDTIVVTRMMFILLSFYVPSSLLLHTYSQNTAQYSPFNIGIKGRAFKPNFNFVKCSKIDFNYYKAIVVMEKI